jgi:hypothetical protein
MPATPEERAAIAERLAEIKADPKAAEKPKPDLAREGKKLDQETTDLLCKLAEPRAADLPAGGIDPTP